MQRNLLSLLIAGLFAAAPAVAQTGRARGSREGVGHARADRHRQSTRRTPRRSSSTATCPTARCRRSCCAAAAPTGDWIDFYGENFGRDDMYINLRGGRYDVLQVPAVHRLADAEPPVQRPHAVQRRGPRRPARDVPAARPVDVELDRHRVRPQGHRRLLRVAAQLAVVLPRRRQPRRARRHEDRLRVERHEPGQRLHRPGRSRSTTGRPTPRPRSATARRSTTSPRTTW